MSSPAAGAQGVNVKVSHFGTTRRFKLNLRDININTFEDKIREFLHIPAGYPCKIERYSDSAASYVVLDRSNIPVYKQLHRAAKAKAKLKIRVTDVQPTQETQKPQPARVETEEEAAAVEAQETPSVSHGMVEKPRENIEVNTQPEQQGSAWTFPLRPRSTFESESQFDQPIVNAPEVPKKEPLDLPLTSPPELPKKDLLFDVPSNSNANIDSLEVASKDTATEVLDFWSSAVNAPGVSPYDTHRISYAAPGLADFRVCCNSCDQTIPDTHYHCSKCDGDDFDLCLDCVQAGITCYGPDHWLIKRFKCNGSFVTSTTEKLPPKSKGKSNQELSSDEVQMAKPTQEKLGQRRGLGQDVEVPSDSHQMKPRLSPLKPLFAVRACNNCVQELPEHNFLHCDTCEDFDLCEACFAKDNHGHHPKHAFAPAAPYSRIADHVSAKLGPGRNQSHNAICDKCDKFIRGIRHKCFDCPDWDYCNDCLPEGLEEHAGHRFAALYEPLPEPFRFRNRTVHQGICCDGPLCAANSATYITGVRYKCAICPDTDFCESCEVHPSNIHNKTHPLIKFKTAVREAVVSTMELDGQGVETSLMGDAPSSVEESRKPTISGPRAVVSVEPSEPPVTEEKEQVTESQSEPQVKEECQPEQEVKPVVAAAEKKSPSASDLGAVYVRDTVMDGTVIQPNFVFEQTWILRNSGKVAWPAGCAVKFVGGDYMGHVDSNHPAGISELVSASESTVCYHSLEPGQEYPFTVLLRTPPREGKIISYWRLTAPDGLKFGHRLWCDVAVQIPKTAADVAAKPSDGPKNDDLEVDSSQMVFPKLEKESPMASIHQDKVDGEKSSAAPSQEAEFDELEEWKGETQTWDGSEDGFFTDEEYDILDASDEEFLQDARPNTAKN